MGSKSLWSSCIWFGFFGRDLVSGGPRNTLVISLLDSNHCYYHPVCGFWVLNSQAFKLQSPRPGRVAISSSGVKVCGSEIRKKFPAWSVLELWDQNLCEVVVFVLFWLWSCLTRSMEYLCHQSKFLSATLLQELCQLLQKLATQVDDSTLS